MHRVAVAASVVVLALSCRVSAANDPSIREKDDRLAFTVDIPPGQLSDPRSSIGPMLPVDPQASGVPLDANFYDLPAYDLPLSVPSGAREGNAVRHGQFTDNTIFNIDAWKTASDGDTEGPLQSLLAGDLSRFNPADIELKREFDEYVRSTNEFMNKAIDEVAKAMIHTDEQLAELVDVASSRYAVLYDETTADVDAVGDAAYDDEKEHDIPTRSVTIN